jgi:uncharacterized protein
MPEYLSPGVYVEEIDTGAKPIEGVSTSTAGMVGVTERGPVNVPILLTNSGDYARWFGGLLDRHVFGAHGHLPQAVEGFFRNGGRRLYLSRVAAPGAGQAELTLHDRGEELSGAAALPSTLLRAAAIGDGLAASPLLVLDAGGMTTPGNPIRIGDGSDAEWHALGAAAAAPADDFELLSFPLTQPYAVAANMLLDYAPAPDGALAAAHALAEAVAPGQTVLTVDSTDDLTTIDPATRLVEVVRGGPRELGRITTAELIQSNIDGAGTDRFRITMARPLAMAHPAGTGVTILIADPAAGSTNQRAPTVAINAGDQFLLTPAGDGIAPPRIVEVLAPAGPSEVRRVANPGRITVGTRLGRGFSRGAVVEHLTLADSGTVTQLTADVAAGARAIPIADRIGLAVGGTLRIGAVAEQEFATIEALPGAGAAPVGPGTVTLAHGLRRAHPAGGAVVLQTDPVATNARSGTLLREAAATDLVLLTSEIDGFGAAGGLRITTAEAVPYIFPLAAAATAGAVANEVELATPLARHQPAGATVARRDVLFRIEALDVGAWGNRLMVAVEDETTGLVARTSATGLIAADRPRLSSLSNIEPGAVLEFLQADGSRLGALVKVDTVNRADGSVTLSANLDADQQAAVTAPGAAVPVRSREFRLTIMLRRPDDPAIPTRGANLEDTELFRNLSMDPRHSRYIATVLGEIGGPPRLSDRRPEGESLYVRVLDLDPPAVRETIRLGPESLVDRLPSGTLRAARHALSGGDDGLATLTDAAYVGVDDREPENRTGIFSLKNIDDISIVAAPGQVSEQVQQALIGHCEEMRYRFAVLDGPAPPGDAIADVQALRQRYDSKYAALYYPWVTLPDPMPGNLAAVAQVPVPPSGHVIGIYARTDIERGVHKAPANEVVRGITGLRRYLNKGEHDILNPFPSNINVIRDFRPDNRAIRVWGARVITSDPDFKYVPVRRLLLFIEKSLDRGLQWVVFEPNDERLWARVTFAIESFLEVVWRNGALEGTTTAQAFAVVCDRTTMTQADIDNGRLICVIGVAPVKPAEFVIIRIGLKTAVASD